MKNNLKKLIISSIAGIFLLIPMMQLQAGDMAAPGKPGDIKAAFVLVGPVGDGGWSYMHNEGRLALGKLPYVKKTAFIESVPEGESERVIMEFARKGFNLIFTTSYGYADPTLNVARRFPNAVFQHCSGFLTSENMGNYFGRIHDAMYLAGMAAGSMTKSNTIGIVAAHPIPEVIRNVNAWALGAQSVNPDVKVHVIWTNSWFDPPREREGAESLVAIGADVLGQDQDSPAVQQVAQRKGLYSTGYNSDMTKFARKAHLVSAVWDWTPILNSIAKDLHEGKWEPEAIWWGLEDGVVGLSPFGKMVPDDLIAKIEAKKQDIINGKFVVFGGEVKDQSGNIVIPAGVTPTDDELLSQYYLVKGVIGSLPGGEVRYQ